MWRRFWWCELWTFPCFGKPFIAFLLFSRNLWHVQLHPRKWRCWKFFLFWIRSCWNQLCSCHFEWNDFTCFLSYMGFYFVVVIKESWPMKWLELLWPFYFEWFWQHFERTSLMIDKDGIKLVYFKDPSETVKGSSSGQKDIESIQNLWVTRCHGNESVPWINIKTPSLPTCEAVSSLSRVGKSLVEACSL